MKKVTEYISLPVSFHYIAQCFGKTWQDIDNIKDIKVANNVIINFRYKKNRLQQLYKIAVKFKDKLFSDWRYVWINVPNVE